MSLFVKRLPSSSTPYHAKSVKKVLNVQRNDKHSATNLNSIQH